MTNDVHTESENPFNTRHQARTVTLYTLTENEIDNLETLGLLGNTFLGFFSAFIGAALSTWLTAADGSGTIAVLLVLAAVPCGIGVFMTYRNSGSTRQQIKKRHRDDAG